MQLAEAFIEAGPVEEDPFAFGRMVRYFSEQTDEPLELVLDSNGAKPRNIGMYLPKGKMIIVRGNLGEETGYHMEGGSLFVDGNVDQIAINSGIVYVDGDVSAFNNYLVSPDPNKIAIVTGNIDRCYLSDNFFVFVPNPDNLKRLDDKERGRVFPVEKAELLGWNPEDLESNTLALFKKMLTYDMLKKQETIESLGSVKDAIGFHKKERRTGN